MSVVKADLVSILLVEDNAADIGLTVQALSDSKIANGLEVVRDGEEALDYLHQRGAHANAPRPDLVILDLNLPRIPGQEVLAEIKGDPNLRTIPVAVLTSSRAEEDILRSYETGVNCYLSKPVDFDQFVSVVHSLEGFWLGIVKLPTRL
jgi:CheY-like chemotaxis protein